MNEQNLNDDDYIIVSKDKALCDDLRLMLMSKQDKLDYAPSPILELGFIK